MRYKYSPFKTALGATIVQFLPRQIISVSESDRSASDPRPPCKTSGEKKNFPIRINIVSHYFSLIININNSWLFKVCKKAPNQNVVYSVKSTF